MPRRIALLAACALIAAANTARADDGQALEAAVRTGDLASAHSALKQGADPDARLAYAATPLALAVDRQDAAMVELLLDHDADPNLADAAGLAPLALACELGGETIVTDLLDAGASFDTPGPDGSLPLARCARFAPAVTVAQMLASGADADARDERGQTALMWAASTGNIGAMRMLLDAGAEANRVTDGNFTPLFFAIKSKSSEAARIMLDAGADTGFVGPEDTSALQLALYQQSWDAAALLLKSGSEFDLRAIDRNGERPLHVAAAAGASELVTLLLDKGADPNGLTGPSRVTWVTEANFGMPPPPVPPKPPLISAAEKGQDMTMRQLVSAGADPAFVAENGTNVVLAAATGGNAETLEYALTLAPDVNVTDRAGMTALHLVLFGGAKPELEAMLRVLRDHCARTDLASEGGQTADQIAEQGLTEVRPVYESVFTGPQANPSC